MRLRPRDTSWILTLLAVGGALAVSAILAGTRLLVPSEQADIPSSTWVWAHDGVLVEPLGPNEPFHYGDVVVAMNGVPLETWGPTRSSPMGDSCDATGRRAEPERHGSVRRPA